MGKRIHITEAQLEGIMDKINEDGSPIVVDTTADIQAAHGNAQVGLKNAKQRLSQQGLSGKDVTLSTDADAIMEECGAPITKRQIKEKRLKQLKESSVCYNKKQLETRMSK